MAKSTFLLSCSLLLVLFVSGCLAQGRFPLRQQGNECQLDRLNAVEPSNRIEAEAGFTEVYSNEDQQFQCAGVSVARRNIEPKGLLLPSYTSAPQLVYVERGRGIIGLLIPGCPETYESLPQALGIRREELRRERGEERGEKRGERGDQQRREERGERGDQERGSYQDQHQKIRQFKKGDIVALPAGVSYWIYNDGEQPLLYVFLHDTSNYANQLDKDFPRILPSREVGNPQREQGESRRQEKGNGNVFSGFDTQLLADSFGVSEELARRIQSEQDDRGNIVRVQEGLHVIRPPRKARDERESHRGGKYVDNGLEETICSARIRENLDNPSRADIYTPQAGRLSTLNSFKLPILRFLRLSAEKGLLYSNAIMAPHYNLNAHSIIYGVNGRARIQIVNEQGTSVFDDELRQGQVVVVPQNFAVVKQAFEDGFEWISFKTNDNAIFQTLAGRTSAIRALPEDVVASIYQIPREQARRLKYNRPENTLFHSRSAEGQRRSE